MDDTATMQGRLEWLVENRAPLDRYGRRSARALSLAAGLSGGHVGNMRTRLRKDPAARFDYETLAALASAAGVRVDWLQHGTGPREEEAVRGRALAAELAREAGVYEPAIQAVLAEPATAERQGMVTIWWVDRMRLVEREFLAGVRPVVTPPVQHGETSSPPATHRRPRSGSRSK